MRSDARTETEILAHIAANVAVEGDCLVWQRHRNNRGYGTVEWRGRRWYVHRLVWRLAYGPIPAGVRILHHCDNPPCARLDHLFAGSQGDNMQDAAAKGRIRGGRPRALDEADLAWAREFMASGRSLREAARQLGVSHSTLRRSL